jgi:hypothetical protein
MQKKIIIKDVKLVKTGTNPKTNKTWALFRVYDAEGNTYTTFSNAYQSQIGKEVEIEVEEQKKEINGNVYRNLVIVDRQKSQAEVRHEEIKKALKIIYQKLQKIEKHLNINQ